jgi:anti-anti-sigma factor
VRIRCEDYDGVCVMSVSGELAGDGAAAARKSAVETIEQRRINQFVIDLEKTAIIDSLGLESLLWIKRRCEDSDGQLKLAGLDANMKKILEVTRLDHRFQCAPDVPTALKTMR